MRKFGLDNIKAGDENLRDSYLDEDGNQREYKPEAHETNRRSMMRQRLQGEEELKEEEKKDGPVKTSVEASDPHYTQMKLSTLKSVPNHFSLVSKDEESKDIFKPA
mmetsp:Transcript_39595/g.60567  ORF Transcript_39595/g.60567 Transcript_39595/m.60567 type:complete len:106 (-) Transcript_39595:2484-2801(-)